MSQNQTGDLFANDKPKTKKLVRRDGITDEGLKHFQDYYRDQLGPDEAITKQDLFYYIYGLLHSPDYRERYADNLSKELPRIPRVKTLKDFLHFSQAGRELGALHVDYETVPMFEGVNVIDPDGKSLDDSLRSPLRGQPDGCSTQALSRLRENDGQRARDDNAAFWRVEKMKYDKNGKQKDLTTLHYNSRITVTGIPLEAYEYVVNGKPALDWVVERQCVKTDKKSGIVNDANAWAIETMGNPRYPLELFLRVITVSLETMKIVKTLPKLDID